MSIIALLLCLVSAPAFASPEWIGTSCYEHDFQGKAIKIDGDICRELFPPHFERNGCACQELTPKNALLGYTDDQTLCGGARPSECFTPEAPSESSYSAE